MKPILRSMILFAAGAVAVGGCNKGNGNGDAGGSSSGMTMMLSGLGASVVTSMPQTVHLAVFNRDGTPASGYVGTVAFTSTDAVAYLPAQYTFTSADAGGHDFLTTLNSAGPQTLTSTDAADSGLTASANTAVAGPAYYYVPPTSGKIRLIPNIATSTPTLAALDLVAMVDLSGYFVGFNVAVDGSKLAPNASLITKGDALDPGSNPPAIAASIATMGPLAGALATGLSQKASGNGAVPADATIATGKRFYTLALPLKSGVAAGTLMDGTVAKNVIRAGLRNKAGIEIVGVADFGIGKLVYTP